MEKEISISENRLVEKLNRISAFIKKKYGIRVKFVEILGKRWSYVAGEKEDGLSSPLTERIKIDERFGLITDRWEEIPKKEKNNLISLLQRVIKKYG
ncbi:hypothetical protein DRJ04_00600 [Candidatus Aerophobetes bacterium]|uniref:Uncharacterized protein n=1 Tax=Aerophobetes bacterium TaxID=2030807 RepID=A0A662DNC9_UNCAE|nr:MAG: hypothetical protein DRJ04_00600 [Candidatus Aerophobetes bacterium]